MTIGMWFVDDIANLLASVQLAQDRIMAHVPQTPEAIAYLAGCADTLDEVATAFGLPSKEQP